MTKIEDFLFFGQNLKMKIANSDLFLSLLCHAERSEASLPTKRIQRAQLHHAVNGKKSTLLFIGSKFIGKPINPSIPKKQKSSISFFFVDPRKMTKIEDFLFFGTHQPLNL